MSSRQLYILTAILLLGILFLGALPSIQQLNQGLSPKDEPITELYMSVMPSVVGGKTNFTFTLHNLMGKDLSYSYVVYVKGTKNEYAVLDNSSVSVADGETAHIEESVTVPYAGGTVYVELPQLGQNIHVAL